LRYARKRIKKWKHYTTLSHSDLPEMREEIIGPCSEGGGKNHVFLWAKDNCDEKRTTTPRRTTPRHPNAIVKALRRNAIVNALRRNAKMRIPDLIYITTK